MTQPWRILVRCDLMGEALPPVETLWEIPAAARLVLKQQANGSWRYPGKSYNPIVGTNDDLLETYRNLRILVEMYGFDRRHPVIQKASETHSHARRLKGTCVASCG